MARSVVISGGSTSNFSGDELVAVGDGRKIRFMENKNCSFQGHATMPSFSATRDAVFIELAGLGILFFICKSFQFWPICEPGLSKLKGRGFPCRTALGG
jgi:hypothetical protein